MSRTQPFPLPVLGVDVLSNETALPKGTVRKAVNVDIDRDGRTKRRSGYQRVVQQPDMHSLFYSPTRKMAFVARGNTLNEYDVPTRTLTTIATMRSAHRVDYTEYNGNLYFTNRTTFGWIPHDSDAVRPVGVQTPSPPMLSESATGNLTPGLYGVSLTIVNDRGEQGGASQLATLRLNSPGGIELRDLPQLPLNWSFCIYVTSPDGDILRFASEFPGVFSSVSITDVPNGEILDTRFLVPLPPGDFVRWHAGRLYTARDEVLRFSEALRPHLHNPAYNLIPFSGAISFIEPVVDGIYVGDDRGVWFLAGTEPSKFELRRVSTCRAVYGSSILIPPEHLPPKQVETDLPTALWLSTSGYVVGMAGGKTVELQPDRVKLPPGLAGPSVFVMRGGRKQVLTAVNSATATAPGVAVDSPPH